MNEKSRGFIVAIEQYPASTELAQRLSGTNQGAEAFRNWLLAKKGVSPADILSCAPSSCAWRTCGTTRPEILDELLKLAETGRDKTSELFFYFSGHGFSYIESAWTKAADVLVGSDFVSRDVSGAACCKLQELQLRLWNALGPGDHYYFIDACRNPISEKDIQVLGLGKTFPTSERGKPTIYGMYSTAEGEVAKTKSGFAGYLVSGLGGSGRAKHWEDGKNLYVTFEALFDYVANKIVGQEVEPEKKGPGKGRILKIDPVPQSQCDVTVENADAVDVFTLQVNNHIGNTRSQQFQGASCQVALPPYDYFMQVTHPSASVVQIAPPPPDPLDLYDSCSVRFRKEIGGPPPPATATTGSVDVLGDPNAEISLEHVSGGPRLRSAGRISEKVVPGTYRLKMRERGVTIDSRRLTVKPGESVRIDLFEAPKSAIREAIVRAIPGAHDKRRVDFSETLGPTANWDLGLWLSLIGASRIVAPIGDFSKLKHLPLASFDDLAKGESVVYVLAGCERTSGRIDVGLSAGPDVQWSAAKEVEGVSGVHERRLPAREGFHLLSFRTASQAPFTLATYCLPNRATLVTFAEAEDGRAKLHQYILPIHHLSQYLDPQVQLYLTTFMQNPLATVRMMALAQGQFERNREIDATFEGQERFQWDELTRGKWLDPVMSLIAVYEIIRRGYLEKVRGDMQVIVANLRTYFGGIPDIEVIANLTHFPFQRPFHPPLLLDGLLALSDGDDILPLSTDKIDYGSPWVMWRGAVRA